MKSESEALFVKQLKENQNIIHKICRLYTTDEDAHKDLFQEITIQLWKAFPNFRGDSKCKCVITVYQWKSSLYYTYTS